MKKETLYKGNIFTLNRERLHDHDWEIIRHPGGVGVQVVRDGKMLFVRQYRPAVNACTLEIPAGKLEYGEDPLTCGLRELNEETGLTCSSMTLIQKFWSTPGFCDEMLYIYQAHDPEPALHRLDPDPDEDLELVWLDPPEALAMAQRNEICDGKTLIAVYLAVLEHTGGCRFSDTGAAGE